MYVLIGPNICCSISIQSWVWLYYKKKKCSSERSLQISGS